ncbi:HD domain-containing protein [uncultured Sanguibacteroides sp.]|uniref:HD domain-containing protein n=1 Tax=uncultured Sanguibacteroides sp. TaxID=1635151 RepID=UPI0025ED5BB6|nr:HD domain-containing protein [uncultured Sanguibacteroides sp.]
MLVTYEDIRKDEGIKSYIAQADKVLITLGYTEHSFPHVVKAANTAEMILLTLGYPERVAELAKIAGYMHDIGNIVNRVDHAQSGAVMAFRLLDRMGMEADEIAQVISAIGNHDEGTAAPVNPIAAALILGDKTDVRRSRVRNRDFVNFDIHDRVNYAVEESSIYFTEDKSAVILDLKIDTKISAVMDYFEIFLGRMLLSRKAAEFLNIRFGLIINDQRLL